MQNAVYSALKPLAFPERLDALAAGAMPVPVHVRIKPTNVCNHACYFCAYRADGMSLGEEMSLRDRIPREKMLEIVDDLIAMGVEAVTFSGGGEPLIYPHIVETVERLAGGGIAVAALTNGSRLTGRVADAMARHATWLRLSVDGWDDESYAAYRGTRPGDFHAMLRNLAEFSARGSRCQLGASIIVDDRNAGHIAELAATLKAHGVVHAKISPCILANDGATNNAYHDRIRETVIEQIAEARGLQDERFRIVDHYHEMETRFDKPYRRCPFAQMLTVIGADCAVYTCQDKAYTAGGRLGSIRERRFSEFWHSEENRAAHAALDPSRNCGHHCVADAKNRLLLDYLALDRAHIAFV